MTSDDLKKLLADLPPIPMWQIELRVLYGAFVSATDKDRYHEWKRSQLKLVGK